MTPLGQHPPTASYSPFRGELAYATSVTEPSPFCHAWWAEPLGGGEEVGDGRAVAPP